MTLSGLLNRFRMLPRICDIAIRSLRLGVFVRESKYLKFSPEFIRIIDLRHSSHGLTVTLDELYVIYSSVIAVSNLDGAIAELGVYKGTTAQLIAEVKKQKELFLFDTFDGMPNCKIGGYDDWELNTHKDTSLSTVQSYLSKYDNVQFVVGTFPESLSSTSINDLDQQRYSFVHLDVDLYQSTLDGLEHFWPRLVPGGRIVSHNFNLKDSPGGRTPGVRKAFLEFFSACEHKIIEVAETQCLVIKA